MKNETKGCATISSTDSTLTTKPNEVRYIAYTMALICAWEYQLVDGVLTLVYVCEEASLWM